MKQKITPNIWFEANAEQAVAYYTTQFPGGRILSTSNYPKSAEEGLADFQLEFAGKALTIDFELGQYHLTAINAGPEFKVNPSISMMLNYDPSKNIHAQDRMDDLWCKISDESKVLKDIDAYPFSGRYGWLQDRYGVGWQFILEEVSSEPRPFIMPSLLFTGKVTNRAEEAIQFYTTVFEDTKVGPLAYYPEDTGPAKKGSLMFGEFQLFGQWFAAVDSAVEYDFTFNEAISLSVSCKDQAEIDYYWNKLSSDSQFEQCGWLKDKFGVSWQIIPENIEELMARPKAYANMMEMKKLVIKDF